MLDEEEIFYISIALPTEYNKYFMNTFLGIEKLYLHKKSVAIKNWFWIFIHSQLEFILIKSWGIHSQ